LPFAVSFPPPRALGLPGMAPPPPVSLSNVNYFSVETKRHLLLEIYVGASDSRDPAASRESALTQSTGHALATSELNSLLEDAETFEATAILTPEIIYHQMLSVEGMSIRSVTDFNTIFYEYSGKLATKATFDGCKAWLVKKLKDKYNEVNTEAEESTVVQVTARKRNRR